MENLVDLRKLRVNLRHRFVRELPSANNSQPFAGGLLDTITSILNSLSEYGS